MERLSGNLRGLKPSELRVLERLTWRRVPPRQLVGYELVDRAAELARHLNRDLAFQISRKGHVERVVVGDGRLDLPSEMERLGAARLSGDRLVIVRNKGGGIGSAELVLLQRHRLDLIAVVEPEPTDLTRSLVWMATLSPLADSEGHLWRLDEPHGLREVLESLDVVFLVDEIEREFARYNRAIAVETGKEKALLAGVQTGDQTHDAAEASMDELDQLAQTAGAEVLGRVLQKRDRPDPATLVGSGKAEALALMCQEQGATMLLLNEELSPGQQANLEKIVGVKVVDRTALILDIFAQRAHTREGKLQVELAQLNYRLPRLAGRGEALSRLGGGIGTRGPGETKLESDRRRIRARITQLEREVKALQRHRARLRHGRVPLPQFALVGYTNAGKSTLLNTLTRASVLAEDRLFATLDPTTRRLVLPNREVALVSDTVGFIQHLPHMLVAAFRATLEEVVEADALIHVVDGSHPEVEGQVRTVLEVLDELGVSGKPILTVINKRDLIDAPRLIRALTGEVSRPLLVSALHGTGISTLLDEIARVARQLHPHPIRH
ncbi:GTPase HflX [bacterium]|nr:GTPase HflX [bacterium]